MTSSYVTQWSEATVQSPEIKENNNDVVFGIAAKKKARKKA
ncbi:hypothetical protein [Paralcaligenes ginsengisoli]